MKLLYSLLLLVVSATSIAQDLAKSEPIPYEKVAVKPEFSEGEKTFQKFVMNQYKAPENPIAYGKITVSFVIMPDGSLTGFRIVEHLGLKSAEDLIKVIKKAGKWNPGLQDGKPVAVSHKFSVTVAGPEN